MESHIREVLIGTEIEEDVTELPIGVHDIDDKNLWVRTAEQQSRGVGYLMDLGSDEEQRRQLCRCLPVLLKI